MVKTLVTKDMTEKDIMKYWGSDVVAGSGYTDEVWRAECEQRRMNLRVKAENEARVSQMKDHMQNMADIMAKSARNTQIGGDHYKNMGVEPWDVVDTWPIEQRIGAYRHGALKYLMRMGSKDEHVQEIKKAGHYIEKLIEVLEERDGNV